MASKDKRRSDQSRAAAGTLLRAEVDRLIAKEKYKDAVKQAKLCYRQEGTPEHHRLLEQAYFLRAQQLLKGGMLTAAQEVLHHLLEFGLTDPALTEPAAALMMSAGMADRALEVQGRLDAPEARERLIRQAADQAVLRPERSTSKVAGIGDGAARVRAALESLAAGDEPKAMASLHDLARNSPFGDWKLFVRGLAAFQRREPGDARSNWDRLDPGRAPARIARALLAVDGAGTGSASFEGGSDDLDPAILQALERLAFGGPVLGPLRALGGQVAGGEWPEAIRMISTVRFALRKIDPALAGRLTEALSFPLIRHVMDLDYREASRLVKDFTRVAEPPAIDPRWNRLWAMVWDGPHGHPEEAEVFWRRYLDDLGSSPAIRPDDRAKAKSLVLKHVGEEWADFADEIADGPRRVDPEVADARRRAVATLDESLRLDPTNIGAYEILRDCHRDWDQPDLAAEASRRLLRVSPDDFDSLVQLASHHALRDEHARALEYVLLARALKPLDPATSRQEWAIRVSLARDLALGGRFDDARAELEAAARILPEISRGTHFVARRAALELKAGLPDRASSLIDEEAGRLAEPTPLWLALVIEASRLQLPKTDVDRFEAQYSLGLAKKARSDTAGALADLVGSFIAGKITYPRRDEHARQVIDYLRRTTRLKYAHEDLVHACGLISMAKGDKALLEKLANRGAKLFPDSYVFTTMLAGFEMDKGPFKADLYKARGLFERALAQAQARESTDPLAAEAVARIKRTLSGLMELTSGPAGLPFFGGRPGGPPRSMLDAIAELLDEAGIDPDEFNPDDEDDAPPASAAPPRRQGRRR